MLSKKLCLFTILVALVVAFGATAAQAGAKVEICHLPPGNPANFHTITVSENALTAHYGHGDLPGSCFANCETLCDDGDACSIDACDEATETCLADHPPVDCDDGNLCTTDSCDSTDGCQYAPIACDDGDNCTVDTCNPYDGQCTGTPIDCGSLGVCVADTGQCDFPCDGITCDPIDQCHEAGECVLPGECLDGAAVADGTACDDGDAGTENDACSGGVCAGETAGPCSGVEVLGARWFLGEGGSAAPSCTDLCNSCGLTYDEATRTVAGGDGGGGVPDNNRRLNCVVVLDALEAPGTGPGGFTSLGTGNGLGCVYVDGGASPGRKYVSSPATTADARIFGWRRACACQ